jgi:hypothetical protein
MSTTQPSDGAGFKASEHPGNSIDRPTLVAVALIAYVLADILHEAVGHGEACLLAGCQPIVLSTVHFECSCDSRFVSAGGTLVNLLVGLLCLPAIRLSRSLSSTTSYFLWLMMTVNLLQAAGCFLFSGAGNIGDWAEFFSGFSPAWLWRVGLILLGSVLYLLSVFLTLRELTFFLGSTSPERERRALTLTVFPYLIGGLLSCFAGLFNPVGMILVAISAGAASFGDTSGLAWMAQLLKDHRFPTLAQSAPLSITRGWPWIVVATILALLFVTVLGPGLKFRSEV